MSQGRTDQTTEIRTTRSADYRDGYANSVQVRMSVWDFQLIFGTAAQVAAPTGNTVEMTNFQGIYLSPQQAKALWNILGHNLGQYEQTFGKVAIEPTPSDCFEYSMTPVLTQTRQPKRDEGFMLLAAIVMVFLVLLALSVAAPRVAMDLKRDRELEAQHRAQQYQRAIRVYYQKFKHYPGSVEQLEKSNNQKFLRQRYLDPLTGKDDWRLIHVGENKTTVKGFFGDDLPGLGGGLNAGGLTSSTGGTTGGSSSAFNNSGTGNGSNSGTGFNAGNAQSPTSGTSATGNTGSTSGSGSGVSSQSTDSLTGTGGPIMGIGSSKTGDALLTVNGSDTYQDWEFLYDPRIEQLYAKGNLLGGIGSGSGGNGLGTTPLPTGIPGTSNPANPNGNQQPTPTPDPTQTSQPQ